MQLAAIGGHLHVAKWLHETFTLSRGINDSGGIEVSFRWACAYGHLDVAQWLYETFEFTRDDALICYNEALCRTEKSHVSVERWLYKTFKFTRAAMSYCISEAIRQESMEKSRVNVTRWLRDILR